jgi:hypothetical protein
VWGGCVSNPKDAKSETKCAKGVPAAPVVTRTACGDEHLRWVIWTDDNGVKHAEPEYISLRVRIEQNASEPSEEGILRLAIVEPVEYRNQRLYVKSGSEHDALSSLSSGSIADIDFPLVWFLTEHVVMSSELRLR